MCGIFLYYGNKNVEEYFELIKNRGPDNTQKLIIPRGNKNLFFGFHRLSINDTSDKGNQPFEIDDLVLICNGEIYNYKELKKEFSLETHSDSDCEIILHLYKYFDYNIEKVLELLDGVYAFVIYDKITQKITIGRDRFGVRSLYFGTDTKGNFGVASEMKSISFLKNVRQFSPGSYMEIHENNVKCEYKMKIKEEIEDLDYNKIYELLTNAVYKRVSGLKDVGCLLSGGLDSSIVAFLASKFIPNLKTFSIGFENSPDLIEAKKVAEYIKSDHHEVIITPEEALQEIPNVIKTLETYDTTTIRAGTPMFLLCKYIKKKYPELKVILSGEGADEVFGGYKYLSYRKKLSCLDKELKSLINNIHFFDGLRADKCISQNSLEARLPFLDYKFVSYINSIPIKYKDSKFDGKNIFIEKQILRETFKTLIKCDVINRKKEAFSDGISVSSNSWHTIIKKHMETIELKNIYYSFNTPDTHESQWYREIFESYYPNKGKTIHYYWKQKWTFDGSLLLDPSAREL